MSMFAEQETWNIVYNRVLNKKICRRCGALNSPRAVKCRRCKSYNLRTRKIKIR